MHGQTIEVTPERWDYSTLVDSEALKLQYTKDMIISNAEKGIKRAAKQFRFPTLKCPVDIYYWEPNAKKPTYLGTASPEGERDRDRWRSLVVAVQKGLDRRCLFVQTQYDIRRMAELVSVSTYLLLVPSE